MNGLRTVLALLVLVSLGCGKSGGPGGREIAEASRRLAGGDADAAEVLEAGGLDSLPPLRDIILHEKGPSGEKALEIARKILTESDLGDWERVLVESWLLQEWPAYGAEIPTLPYAEFNAVVSMTPGREPPVVFAPAAGTAGSASIDAWFGAVKQATPNEGNSDMSSTKVLCAFASEAPWSSVESIFRAGVAAGVFMFGFATDLDPSAGEIRAVNIYVMLDSGMSRKNKTAWARIRMEGKADRFCIEGKELAEEADVLSALGTAKAAGRLPYPAPDPDVPFRIVVRWFSLMDRAGFSMRRPGYTPVYELLLPKK